MQDKWTENDRGTKKDFTENICIIKAIKLNQGLVRQHVYYMRRLVNKQLFMSRLHLWTHQISRAWTLQVNEG